MWMSIQQYSYYLIGASALISITEYSVSHQRPLLDVQGNGQWGNMTYKYIDYMSY